MVLFLKIEIVVARSQRSSGAHCTCLCRASQKISIPWLRQCSYGSLHHMDPFAVGADPGWAVADPPFIFLETVGANLKTTATVPAEGFFLFAAVAAKFFFFTTATLGFWFVGYHRITRFWVAAVLVPSSSGSSHPRQSQA